MTSLLRIITVVALVSLLHCAYSAAQHRFYLRLTEQPFTQLPADIIVQTLVSLIVLIYGAAHVAGDFQPIRSDIQNRTKSWDTVGNCPSFYSFDHRAKALSPTFSAISKQCYEDTPQCSPSSQELLNKFCIGYVDSRYRYLSSFPILSTSTVEHKMESTTDPHRKLKSPNFMQPSEKSKPKNGKQAPSRLRSAVDNKSAMAALDHCIALTRNRDFANYIGALLMPTEVQPSVFALLAFNVELAVIRDQIERNSGTAGIYRLQFWKDTIEAIYGDRGGPIPKQPVALALQCFVPDVDVELLSCLVLARQQTLGDRPFKSIEAVQQYGVNTYGALMKLLIRVLARNRERVMHAIGKHINVVINEKTLEVVDLLAGAMALVTLLRSSIPLLSRGIILLPDDFMHIHGLSADSFYRRTKPEAMKSLAKDISLLASSMLDRSRKQRDEVPCVLRSALLASAATVEHLVRILYRCDFNLFDARLQREANLLAWRLWWRSILGRY